ncbi:MAG TPA: hypothetical protein VLX92_34630 [Kofleriaceae bacterium]|nr:hypothetical protein [Kofleriaceae bacterium]
MAGTYRSCVLFAVVAASGCGGKTFPSLCDEIPAPQACNQSCDPDGPNTCPAGFFCDQTSRHCNQQCTPGGNQCGSDTCSPDGQCVSGSGCTGLQCQQVDCTSMGLAADATQISGTVFAPNGTLPLYGINVYVPNSDPGPMPPGLTCNQCTDSLPGNPVVQVTTDEAGKFTLANMPVGTNIPLVIVSGKWRRQITIPNVAKCMSTPIDPTDTTLPKSTTDMTPNTKSVDMPAVAISTGGADALECLIRKLGISDTEIGTAGGPQRIHLYADTMSSGEGTDRFKSGFAGGSGNFADSQTLWGSFGTLSKYDIVIFSCEGRQASNTKPQAAMDALKMYADMGGRVFLSHWHNIWIEGATTPTGPQKPAVWTSIATWNNSSTTFTTPPDTIDEINNPKGASFATWMLNVMGSTTRDQVDIGNGTGKNTVTSVDNTRAERWVYWTGNGGQVPQNFQFTTPNEASTDQRCGKVVFSDMHVSGDSSSSPGGTGYPSQCSTQPLTPQEKALAFMFFDIASCVSTVIQ